MQESELKEKVRQVLNETVWSRGATVNVDQLIEIRGEYVWVRYPNGAMLFGEILSKCRAELDETYTYEGILDECMTGLRKGKRGNMKPIIEISSNPKVFFE